MSIIYFAICTLFLSSTIFALSAPPDVYSAVINNAQNSPIQCNIIWSTFEDQTPEPELFTVNINKNHFVHEKIIHMDTWDARAAIQEIDCGGLVLTAPFDGVTSPTTNWEFRVETNQIISVGPCKIHHQN